MERLTQEEKKKLFTDCYSRWYTEFYRYAFYFMGNPDDAEDAVSDALTAAYSAFDGLRDVEKFKFWFLKILQNNCKTKLKGRVPVISLETVFENGTLDIPDETTDLELTAAMKQLLAALKPTDRNVVLMSVLGGYSSDEVALATGLTPVNVRVKLHRTLAALRKQIADTPAER